MTPVTISMLFWCANGKALKWLWSSLKNEEGVSSFFTRGRALVAHFEVDEEGLFELPACILNTEASWSHKNSFILLQEKGDGKRRAQIVCGTNGEKIPYLFIKKNVVNFLAKEAMLVSAENNGDNTVAVKIESFKMEAKRDGIELKWSLIFDGQCSKNWFDDDAMNLDEIQLIPDDILLFYFPVRAAVYKSRGRVRPHYIPSQDKKQPSRGFFILRQAIASRCLV